ncbi:MAG TPA: GTPase ObgE [Candidatus Paceibacterota bacterium]|nr:GTPase ObgE [Candidatus Paceibacterota bacterium]
MAFVDEVKIHAQAGKGGDGVVRWLRTKETARGGPSGGDGGRGGSVILEGVRDLAALGAYRYEKKFKAEAGQAGANESRHGRDGADAVLKVPVGTVARTENGEELEIKEAGERLIVFKGGRGGKGNIHFKSSTNQNPWEQTDGTPGEGGDIFLTLKLIADAGLIGLPNAGKSSLLNELTRAKSKVGAYAFTTLEPALGDFFGYILADIPGLIEGASAGRGLGTRFLKHIERTKILVHLVSATQEDPAAAYREVRSELKAFGRGLSEKPELVLLSKTDEIGREERETRLAALARASGQEVLPVSTLEPELLKALADRLAALLRSAPGVVLD